MQPLQEGKKPFRKGHTKLTSLHQTHHLIQRKFLLRLLQSSSPPPRITQNNQHKQPQNRCDSDRPYRYESHRHHRCDSHRFKSSRCVHFDQSEATFQDWKKHGFTHHFTSTTNVHPYLPQAATRLIRCSKSCEKCMGEIVTLAKGLET